MRALGLADGRCGAASRRPWATIAVGHQPVVDDDVGLLQRALGAERQQVLRPGPAPTSETWPDAAGSISSVRSASSSASASAAGKDLLGDGAGEEVRPVAAAVGERGERRADAAAQRLGERGKIAERRRQHRLDAGADLAGEHRRDALAADGDGKRRAVDQGRRIEIAKLGTVDAR